MGQTVIKCSKLGCLLYNTNFKALQFLSPPVRAAAVSGCKKVGYQYQRAKITILFLSSSRYLRVRLSVCMGMTEM